jgi:predicted alpha/beta-fold hydrolase
MRGFNLDKYLIPRFSLTETALMVLFSMLVAWYVTGNFMRSSQQSLLYETSLLMKTTRNLDAKLDELEPDIETKVREMIQKSSAEARSRIPAPEDNKSTLKILLFGPDDDYIYELRNSIRDE